MKIITLSKNTLLRHGIIWFCLVLYVSFFNFVVGPPMSKIVYVTIFLSNFVIAYYCLLNIIFPSFFEENKLLFFLNYFLVIIIFISIDYIHLKKILPFFGGHTPRGDLSLSNFVSRSLLLFSYIAFTTCGWYLNYRSIQKAKEKDENEKIIIQSELGLLKNQFSSHLTFNFLNFCYSKMFEFSPKAATAVENFSDMLHYSFIYKSADPVPLAKEIEYIENFIEVQKCITSAAFVEFQYEGCIDEARIIPMLLAIFVENSFKHGVTNEPLLPIRILLSVNDGDIFFNIKNMKANKRTLISTGFGLQNAKKVLNSFYKDRFKLMIDETDNMYSFEISLKNI